jgi:hypothetical protein
MAKTYRAVQVSKPGRLEVVEREVAAPPPGKVRIRVEACGKMMRNEARFRMVLVTGQ